MSFKKALAALAVTAGLCLPVTGLATTSNYTTYAAGQTLTAASLNGLQTNYTNGDNAILDGDTFTGNMLWYSGTDIQMFSDSGSTLKFSVDGADGSMIGAPKHAPFFYNLNLVNATTTNANDSIKIQCGNATCSATNPGFVITHGTTAGQMTIFAITADVTINITGAHWGAGTTGDLTGEIHRVGFANDNGTARWCVVLLGGRNTLLTTDTTATATSATNPESALCNSAVASATNTFAELGWFRGNFDDTGGAAEDLWAIQTGVNDINLGSADGYWQPFNSTSSGFTADPLAGTFRWTQVGRVGFIDYEATAETSDSTSYGENLPFKARQATSFPLADPTDNGSAVAVGVGRCGTGTIAFNLFKSAAAAWTASGNKGVYFQAAIEIGPSASFIE